LKLSSNNGEESGASVLCSELTQKDMNILVVKGTIHTNST